METKNSTNTAYEKKNTAVEKTKYPLQTVAVKRTETVFSLENHLSWDKNAPLSTPAFSRFIAYIIDKSGEDTVAVKANIPQQDVAYIKRSVDIIIAQRLAYKQSHNQPAQPENNDDIFETKYLFGPFKGMSPGEVLMRNPKDLPKLEKDVEMLKSQLSRYPSNQKLINAILKAKSILQKDGQIKQQQIVNTCMVAYQQNYKFLKTMKDAEDRYFVYSICMECDFTRDYPWTIVITNRYAPVRKTSFGGSEVVSSEMVNKRTCKMIMTEAEFYSIVNSMESAKNSFESMHYVERYQEASKILEDNKRAFSNP